MTVIRFQVTVTNTIFPLEEKLNSISPVLQFQNICLHVLIAKEIICVFVQKINMPTATSDISGASVANRLSNKDTTCHCSFRFDVCTLNVTSTMTSRVSAKHISGREACSL